MLNSDELVLALVDICGARSDFGRTSLQKLAYLATAALGWPNIGHTAHYYGPFSRHLERDVARLVASNDIEEIANDLGFVGTGGFPAKRFRYRLTASGQARALELRTRRPDDIDRLESFVGHVQEAAGGLDQSLLSLAAKVHYIVAAQSLPVEREEIVDQARHLGWTLSKRQIDQVAEILAQLSLIRWGSAN